MAPQTLKKTRTDVRFDFVDKLPTDVPPIEQPPTSLFPFPPPVGPAVGLTAVTVGAAAAR